MPKIKVKSRRRSSESSKSIFIPIGRFLSRVECVRNLKIKKVLGQGRYGTVASVCRGGKCKYVVKIQKLDRRGGGILTQRDFWDEVAVSAKAGQLGISPKVKDAWECDGNGYIVMTRIKGETLLDVLQNDPNLERVITLQKNAKDALKKAHAAGLLHRDIHAQNIMVKKNNVFFIDWGLKPERQYTKADDRYLLNVAFTDPFLSLWK